jgi:preprotein translocase subunit SecA
MDSLREAVYLRAYGQKDPLIEYKNEAYEIFTELMTSIQGEILHNLFRSTSNLMAFEQFLANLPQHLEAPQLDGDHSQTAPRPDEPAQEPMTLPTHREMPKVGRNDPCPCGSGKKFKSCCGRTA